LCMPVAPLKIRKIPPRFFKYLSTLTSLTLLPLWTPTTKYKFFNPTRTVKFDIYFGNVCLLGFWIIWEFVIIIQIKVYPIQVNAPTFIWIHVTI
jgi:hypothetical protein